MHTCGFDPAAAAAFIGEHPFATADIPIWEEGVFHLLDASKTFTECRRLLKPNGYLVMHETILGFESSKTKLPDFGFKPMDEHILPKHLGWTNYGAPLKDRIRAYRDVHGNSSDSKKLSEYDSVVVSIESDPDRSDCGMSWTGLQK
jgi:hypothetical protein